MKIGIRKETQYPSERRAALTPEHVNEIVEQGVSVLVEPADEQRVFTPEEYENSGAVMDSNFDDCSIIFGVKEVPIKDLIPNKPFVFFSHTIKGQDYNMPLLQRFIDQKATLIDYELITDTKGKRTIAFGEHAGIAGAVDSFWIAGQKFKMCQGF